MYVAVHQSDGVARQILSCVVSLMMVTEAPVSTSMMSSWPSTFTVVFKCLVAGSWRGYKVTPAVQLQCPPWSGALAVSELVQYNPGYNPVAMQMY